MKTAAETLSEVTGMLPKQIVGEMDNKCLSPREAIKAMELFSGEKADFKRRLLAALSSLSDMWNQYCPPPWFHEFMSAGEDAEDVLEDEGLLAPDRTAIDPLYTPAEDLPDRIKQLLP